MKLWTAGNGVCPFPGKATEETVVVKWRKWVTCQAAMEELIYSSIGYTVSPVKAAMEELIYFSIGCIVSPVLSVFNVEVMLTFLYMKKTT